MENPLKRFTAKVSHLSPAERQRLAELADQVDRGLRSFATAGNALRAIRDEQLYREDFETFEAFVEARWRISKQHAYRLIEAAAIVANLPPSPTGDEIRERQVRPLRGLPAADQAAAWSEATEAAGGTPTADQVETAAAKRRPPRSRRAKKHKPIRFRVPGGTVIIEPNKAFTDPRTVLAAALARCDEADRKAA